MKKILILFCAFLIYSCTTKDDTQVKLNEVLQISNNLKPGLGEYMAMVEYHHINLGKAIFIKNYKRANYELDELDEVFEKIKLFHTHHEKLVQPVDSLLPLFFYTPISKLREAISKNDSVTINQNFVVLTNGCNSCHAVNKMEFIIVK